MYKVIGIERRQYTNKQGRNVSGYNLYLSYESKNVEGIACFKEWCGDGLMEESGVQLGDTVDFLYNRYGKVCSIRVV